MLTKSFRRHNVRSRCSGDGPFASGTSLAFASRGRMNVVPCSPDLAARVGILDHGGGSDDESLGG